MSKTITKLENKEKFEEIKNVPYPLPEGWKWVRLGEIFDIKRGGSPRPISKYLTTDKDGISWIKIGDVKEGSKYIVKTKEKIKPEGKKKSRIVKPDDLLLSNSMSYGKAFISKIEGCIHDGWLLLRPISKDIFTEYFYYLLNSYVITLQFRENVQGGIVKNLNIEIVKNTIAPLPFKNGKPDLEKQKQIVEKIETIFKEIDKAIALRQKALEDTKKLFESILNKIFKEAEEDKENWKLVRLGEVGRVFAGSSAPQDKKYFKDGKYPFVRVSDLGKYGKTTRLIEVSNYINEHAIKEKRLVKAKKGTIIFPKSGAAILTNNKGVLGLDAYVVSHLACIEPKENIDNYFVFYMLYNLDFKNIVNNLSYPSLTLKEIKEINIPIPIKNNQPDLEKQKQIAEYLDNLHNKIKQLEELQEIQIEKFKQLKESILNKAFRGELI